MTSTMKHKERSKRNHSKGLIFGMFSQKNAIAKQKKENAKGFAEMLKNLIRTKEKG